MTSVQKLLVALVAVLALAMPATALAAPSATTGPATDITSTGATVTGSVSPGGDPTTYFFQYGTTTAYGSQTPNDTANGNATKSVKADLTGLAPNTTYHYRLVATNATGTSTGADMTFKTGGAALTIASAAPRVVFGSSTTISGQLNGPGNAGVSVQLQQNPFPYTGGFKDVGTPVVTDSAGRYQFTVTPALNTRYRVVAKTAPPTTSAEITIGVRLFVSRRVSDATPRRGQIVRFGGIVRPAHDGQVVAIQRRSSTGRYRTVAKTVLRKSSVSSRSIYSKRVRIYRSGRYRVRVATGDGDHLKGTSRSVVLRVG